MIKYHDISDKLLFDIVLIYQILHRFSFVRAFNNEKSCLIVVCILFLEFMASGERLLDQRSIISKAVPLAGRPLNTDVQSVAYISSPFVQLASNAASTSSSSSIEYKLTFAAFSKSRVKSIAMSKFKPGTVEKKSVLIGPPTGVELYNVRALLCL